MAALHHRTSSSPAGTEDAGQPLLVTYEEACYLLSRTGHKVSLSTLRRYGLRQTRQGRVDMVDWADVLEEHARRTGAKLRAAAR